MTTSVALLRGINVGGRRTVRMADVRAVFLEAGCRDVTTYIQSGNVVFTLPTPSPEDLRAELGRRLEAVAGFEVPVVLRRADELAVVVRDNPFREVDPGTVHVAFLAEDPPPGTLDAVDLAAFAPEEVALVGRDVYLHLPDGMGRAKLPQALPVLRTAATVRNWKTVTKLLELASR
jgi:uncharacterized protein (DUF1697 family)